MKSTKTEERLKESEDRYKILFENTRSIMLIINPDSADIVDANPAALAYYGWSYKQITGMKISDINILSGQEVSREMEKAKIEKRDRFHFKHRLANGEIRDVEVSSGPIVFSGKTFLFSIVNDITERKIREKKLDNYRSDLETIVKDRTRALKLSEARFRNIFTHINSGVAIYEAVDNGKDFKIVDFNPAGERIEKIKAKDIIGCQVTEVFPGIKDLGLLDVMKRVWQTSAPERHLGHIYRDHRIWGWRDNYVFKLPSGEIVAVYDDVTEKKQTEAALKKAHDFYQSIVNSINDTLVVINGDYTVALANHSAMKAAGISHIEGSMTCHQMSHSSPRPCEGIEHTCPLKKVIDTKSSQKVEHIHKDDHGNDLIVELVASPIFDEDGNVVQIIELARDVTENKKSEMKKQTLENQLRQTQKMEAIGTLAGGIAHDFNNILSGIFGYSQLAISHAENPSKVRQSIEHVMKGAQRASELIRQILTFSRQTEYQKKPLRINAEVSEALKLLRASIPTSIELKTKIKSTSIVLADPIRIHQVIMNLCTNAYHAMKETGGVLTVSLTDEKLLNPALRNTRDAIPQKHVKLEVTDTGYGMDEKTMERVFEPYYTTKNAGDGTGLGLSLVKAIVEEHDAFIEMKSEPGKGTRVQIHFPSIVEPKEPENQENLDNDHFFGNATLMVVDDEEPIRNSYRNIFENFGYTVECFEDGITALEEFEKDIEKYNLILTDMTMPRLNGDQLSSAILNLRPDMPIILLTGFNSTISESKAKKIGIREYLQKPVTTNKLLSLVHSILD